LFLNLRSAKADLTEIVAYNLITPDTTPLLKGTVDDSNATVTVTVEGHEYAAVVDGNTWSAQVTDVLIPLDEVDLGEGYAFSVVATLGEQEIFSEENGLVIGPADFPYEIYVGVSGSAFDIVSLRFLTEATNFTEILGFSGLSFSVDIPEGTIMTSSNSETFPLFSWVAEDNDSTGSSLIKIIRFGLPDYDILFSKSINIAVNVGESYNGRTIGVFTREQTDADWENIGTCQVSGGVCIFSIDHASYFGLSEAADSDGDSDEPEEAKIDSWSAYKYTDSKNKSCTERLKLIINGHRFDKNIQVFIGSKEASKVNRKSSQKLTADFCLTKLLNNKANYLRRVIVQNPDTDEVKAKKKIDLNNLSIFNK
jgi:hypothetical protein